MTTNLTNASLELFLALVEDAPNWSGEPLFGGNVGGSKADEGNLTDLKRKGLLTTLDDGGDAFVIFTDAGKALAAEHGFGADYFG